MADTPKTLSLRIFTKGKQVTYGHATHTVEYVHVIGYLLMVKLSKIDTLVDSEMLTCAPTVFQLPYKVNGTRHEN